MHAIISRYKARPLARVELPNTTNVHHAISFIRRALTRSW